MTLTPPPPVWQPRSSVRDGQFLNLSANNQGYPQEDVERAMRSGSAVFSARFELYTNSRQRVEPDLENVMEATVSWDESQQVNGSLEMRLLPDERLRYAFFKYIVKPYARVKMPDGGYAEFPMGMYPWTRPKRRVFGTGAFKEEWTITLGDQMHLLDIAGPGEAPYLIWAGIPVGAYIRSALYEAGFDYYDQPFLTHTDALVSQTNWYTYVTTARNVGNPTESLNPPQQTQPESWLNVLKDLHAMAGFAPGFFERNGYWVARMDRRWHEDPPDVVYDDAYDGVTLLPVDDEPNLDEVANRVMSNTEAVAPNQPDPFGTVNVNQFQVIVDLNDYMPNHPLAQRQIQRYIDKRVEKPKGVSYNELWWLIYTELMRSINSFEKLTLRRVGFLAQHDGPGMVGVHITGDQELSLGRWEAGIGVLQEQSQLFTNSSAVALYRETARKYNLMTGDGEGTLSSLARLLI